MGNPLKPIASTAAAVTLDWTVHGGTTLVMNKADGWTVTLPAATATGNEFEVYVGTTITSNTGIVAAAGSDVIQGGVSVSTDAAGVTILTTATSDKISMNGGTTGGLVGSHVRLKDVASGVWRVGGFLISTGAEATPFSAT